MPTLTASNPLNPTVQRQVAYAVARANLGVYGHMASGLAPALHHKLWIKAIQAVLDGTAAKRKLLIIAPPGHAKSTWVSQLFPAWYLGNHPDQHLLFFTSNDPNARIYSGVVKGLLEDNDAHNSIFPEDACKPNADRGWSSDGLFLKGAPATEKDPSYRAMGFGSSPMGARAHGIIIDDPLNQEQALSTTEVEKAKRYYAMTISRRLHPRGFELAIMTRWSDNDFASYLMAQPDWDVLQFPAIGAYPWGPVLWPERFPLDWLHAERASTGSAVFSAVFQGDPTALGGHVFKESRWFRPLPEGFARQGMGVLQFWDLNLSGKATGDYAACATAALDQQNNLYLTGMFRDRLEGVKDTVGDWTFGQQHEDALVAQINLWRPHWVGVEKMAFKQRAVLDLIQRVQRRALVAITAVEVSTDKVMRARLPAARAEAGMLFVDRRAPWYPDFESEAMGFPLQKHDDMVDSLSGVAALAVEAQAKWMKPQQARQAVFG